MVLPGTPARLRQLGFGLVPLDGAELVVDVGCGDSQYLGELARRGHRGRLIGIDISAGMLAEVQARAGRLIADAEALPLADAVADLALAMHMLYHVPGKQTAGELRRVTKPSGRLVVALPGPQSLCELHHLVDRCAARCGLAVAAHDPGLTLHQAAGLFLSRTAGGVRCRFRDWVSLRGL